MRKDCTPRSRIAACSAAINRRRIPRRRCVGDTVTADDGWTLLTDDGGLVAQFERTVRVNLFGVYHTLRAAAPQAKINLETVTPVGPWAQLEPILGEIVEAADAARRDHAFMEREQEAVWVRE